MGAGARHAGGAGGAGDAAGFDERGEEDALAGGGPVVALGRRGGGGFVVHRLDSGWLESIQLTYLVRVGKGSCGLSDGPPLV